MLLNNVTLLGKSIDLTDKQAHEDSNVVTIMMGSNGSGKSRIFQAICSAFIYASHNDIMPNHYTDVTNLSDLEGFDSLSYIQDGDLNLFSRNKLPFHRRYDLPNDAFIILISGYPYEDVIKYRVHNVHDDSLVENIVSMFLHEVKQYGKKFQLKKNGEICDTFKMPNKVLAVTGSPYDKFPFKNSHSGLHSFSSYVYLGTREKRQAGYRRNRGYLSYKFDQLGASFIKLLLKPKQEYFDFSKMLDFLNISSSFTLKLYFSDRIRSRELNQESIIDLVRSVKFFKDKDHEMISEDIDKEELSKRLLEAIKYVGGEELEKEDYRFDPIEILCQIDLAKGDNDKLRLSSLELLSEYDLVELDDVVFSKTESNQEFLLSQASSGELSLLFTMSSIAGEIQNGSLILIDEPEISLHPKWQLNFLSLLTDIFSNYKACHFIIATHSPNIISSIPSDNAYIVNVDTDEAQLMPSKMYHNRSADFQLASVFNAPGNNNEYLLSQVIEVLDNLCKSKEFDNDSLHRAKWLLTFENKVPDGDKVKVLLRILKQTMEALNIK